MCEPLRGKGVKKKLYDPSGIYADHTLYFENDVKSAIEGLIKFHEDEIERIVNMEYYTDMEKAFAMSRIHMHYDSLQTIEYWLEDAI